MATQPDFTCATCDVTITHHPTFHLGLAFCCAGCAADGPCMCSYDVEEAVPVAATAEAATPDPVTDPRPEPVAVPPTRPAATPVRTRAPVLEREAVAAVALGRD